MKKQNPPAASRGHGRYGTRFQKEAATLRANPGTWYLFDPVPHASRVASSINSGCYTSLRDGYQAVSRRGDLYVRYNPQDTP